MRPGTLWRFYLARLRTRPVHELLALLGIATGVALVFAVQVSNTSIAGSIDQLVHAVTGEATLEVATRSDQGFNQDVAKVIGDVDGVAVAAPVLERRVTLSGPRGERTILLIGATYDLARLDGPVTRMLGPDGVQLGRGLLLPAEAAEATGARADHSIDVRSGGRLVSARVTFVLPGALIGSLAQSPIAVAPLGYAQELAERPGRVTRVLVRADPGKTQEVQRRLQQTLGPIFDVRPSDTEARLIRQAAQPNDQSTSLFAVICAAIGFLFALNAVLLTVPERRRLVADMRMEGFSAWQLASMLAFEAIVLGLAGSLLGLLLGDQLSRHVFQSAPGYLSFAFPVGGQRVIATSAVLLAIAAGVTGSLLATAQPLRDIFGRSPVEGERRARPAGGRVDTSTILAALGGVLLLMTVGVLLLAPAATIVGIGALVLATLLLLPTLLRGMTAVAWWVAERASWHPLIVAVGELRAGRGRGTALAATAALAVFGTTAIEGAHRDLLRGLDHAAYGLTHTADIWVQPGGTENTLTTVDFTRPAAADALGKLDAVTDVRTYQGGFLDYGGRRLWVIGRPAEDRITIPAGQVVDGGDADLATSRIRAGGWAVVSKAVADAQGLRVGERFELPTPAGATSLRLAAKISNVGWAPGTIILNQRDYRRAWQTADPSALEIDLAPGIDPARGAALVRESLGTSASALSVETAQQRWDALRRNARQGLDRLTQISTLVLIGAILATAAAVSATVWQRRNRLAELRAQGFSLGQVWSALLTEAGLLLAFGAVIGGLAGLAGQLLLSRWLTLSTGFPTDYSPAFGLAAILCALVALIALLVIALPGYAAARAPLSLSFRED
ncbi:ABC transporter permease [Conexibacter sp. CPCC 206217]|uniref:ABC transporter permease n=1 Tax=Conexibacter sp. CPCC 206217 TaxID=3064574 RepID=UPI0027207ACA|nr:ABC transporter permease [Conexibacter sp. CPCC 206217]MDO8209657.1 ABC transporter permease [Conexibacter sp. CPCC 206217]